MAQCASRSAYKSILDRFPGLLLERRSLDDDFIDEQVKSQHLASHHNVRPDRAAVLIVEHELHAPAGHHWRTVRLHVRWQVAMVVQKGEHLLRARRQVCRCFRVPRIRSIRPQLSVHENRMAQSCLDRLEPIQDERDSICRVEHGHFHHRDRKVLVHLGEQGVNANLGVEVFGASVVGSQWK